MRPGCRTEHRRCSMEIVVPMVIFSFRLSFKNYLRSDDVERARQMAAAAVTGTSDSSEIRLEPGGTSRPRAPPSSGASVCRIYSLRPPNNCTLAPWDFSLKSAWPFAHGVATSA